MPNFKSSLDISEAITHIPMRPNLYCYLAFSYLGQLYFFRALPFGLNVAPYIFTQVLAWPLHCLRARGISLLAYLDDIVIWHRDRDTLLAQVQQVMVFLRDMGFRLNFEKSQPYPSPSAVWLGVHWLPQTGRWHLPVAGQEAIRRTALVLLQPPLVTRRQIERLVGVINFACQVHRFQRPFLQPLTKGGTIARAAERDTPALLPPPMREALTFWTSPTPWLHVPRFHSDLLCRSLWTEASHHGWAATVAHGIGRMVARGTRPPCQRSGAPGCPPLPEIFRPPTPVSPHLPHLDDVAVDCRSIDWAAFRSLYLFPPSAMLPQLIHRILECPARLVVVVPWKPLVPWFPPLLQGADSHLHLRTTPFQQTDSGTVWHSSGTSARWTALLFCGKSWILDTPAGWSIRCWPHIALLLGDSMTSRGVIFRPGCPLTCPRSPVSRGWNFFSTCLKLLCYRAALKWPLQEAFQVDFGHDDFSRLATGFFHLRLPPSAPLPQWDLNEVLRFYTEVDVATCPLRLAFLKTLFLTRPWLQVTVARSWRTFLVVL